MERTLQPAKPDGPRPKHVPTRNTLLKIYACTAIASRPILSHMFQTTPNLLKCPHANVLMLSSPNPPPRTKHPPAPRYPPPPPTLSAPSNNAAAPNYALSCA